jgi:rRNA maturation endonuclease Nob1
MIRHILNFLIMCEWCYKQFDSHNGRCPTCKREVYTPRA